MVEKLKDTIETRGDSVAAAVAVIVVVVAVAVVALM